MNRKIIPVILIVAAACLALAACMNNGGTTTRPAPTANYAPNATDGANGNGVAGNAQNGNGAAGLTNNANANNNGADGTMNNGSAGNTGNTAATTDGALNPFDWASGAADIEKAIARISEIADARVVVTNSTALVGVKFDNAYKGEITERIREMVAAEVLRADPNIQTVAVTASEDDVNKVYELSEQIRSGRTADELSAQINAIVRNATTLR
ncbi:MAG: YhcN/YlaJ family sporulation lipoprotein [Clostridia bacterium]|nr:YhcN/YlaJ family sporulation lipoprotein [Clostridia bacterium]